MDNFFRRYWPYILGVLLVIAVIVSFFIFRDELFEKKENFDGLISQKEARVLSERVGEIMIVPTDEVPTIATVSDPSLLKNQAFFVDSKKGDKVLIYTNAKKAILYRPDVDKIVTIAPVNLDDKTSKNSFEANSEAFIENQF